MSTASPRVVSLVPSATETLAAWGIVPVAVTRFCERPDLPVVGGTKDPDVAAIAALGPDLVVVCREENRLADAEALADAGCELFVVDIDTLADVEPTLAALAARLGVPPDRSGPTPGRVVRAPAPVTRTAFVPIWRRPWMSLSGTGYGASLLGHLGIAGVFADHPDRYPEVSLAEAAAAAPDLVVAPSEPYPFGERHRAELEAVAPVVLVDGQDLFWWGVRTPAAVDRLAAALAVPGG